MRTLFSHILFLLLAALLGGCTTYLQPGSVPLPALADQKVKLVSIPLPVIASSPNEGITYGALGAFLLHNDKEEVCSLFAPQLNENSNYGITGSLYGAYYPSPDRSLEFNISKSEKVNDDYELKLRDQTLLDKKLEINAFVFSFSDGSARFFGFQSHSSQEDETNYADKERGFTLTGGYPIFDNTQVVLGERFRNVRIGEGAVKKVPFLGDVFTPDEVPGSTGFNAHAQLFSLVYSTLDSATIPTSGTRARMSFEVSASALGSSADYRHYEAEIKHYRSDFDGRLISVGRLGYNQTLGADVPFLERSVLGGENTLRGYGRNRFIDSSYLLCNIEERIRLFRWDLFDVVADWELAPFIDLGGVMKSLVEANPNAFQFNPGVGFRAVIRPNIVGRVDVGFGSEGPAVFVGLGYPF